MAPIFLHWICRATVASWAKEVNDDPPSNGGLRAESPSRAEISKSLR